MVLIAAIALNIVLLVGAIFLGRAYARVYRKLNKLKKLILSRGEDDAEDVTEKIILSKQHLETTFDAITDCICVIDNSFKIIRVNKAYSRFVVKPISEILNRHCFEILWGRNTLCENCPAKITFSEGKKVLGRQVSKEIEAERRHFDLSTFPVIGVEGGNVNVIEYLRDVTDEKRMMEQLFRSERLASIGIMTTGIAHEMNNSLSGICGNASNLLQMAQKYGLNEKGIERVKIILKCADKATTIMKDLLHLSRRNEGMHVVTDINALVEKTVNTSIYIKGYETIERTFQLDPSLPKVLCDPPKIEQVLVNIITNATQSILEKKSLFESQSKKFQGCIVISTHNQENFIKISVTDNGMGIPEEIRSNIFEPFFTTRPPGQGTGLGLSICHRIIEEHRGRIFFESAAGTTTFSVLLPLKSNYNLAATNMAQDRDY